MSDTLREKNDGETYYLAGENCNGLYMGKKYEKEERKEQEREKKYKNRNKKRNMNIK